jgi:hypothetical protein
VSFIKTTHLGVCLKKSKKLLEKIIVDRKIVEGLRAGKSLTNLKKSTGKGKGFVVKTKDLALEFGYIKPRPDSPKIYQATEKNLPIFPEALFPFYDGRSNKIAETDSLLQDILRGTKTNSKDMFT